jgi:hypothetical protein
MRMASAPVAAVALSFATAACSTHYVPQSNGRISVVMDPGPGFMKDGRTYHPGPFGGDIDEAVAGNAKAEEEANTYQNDQTIGFACTLAGLAAILAGGVVLGADFPTSGQANGLPPSLGLALGGIIAEVIGLGFTMSAQTHLWDAINIYNDGVSPVPRPVLVPPAP